MANKPLQSIKFPDLPDTYTVPVVDNTLAVSGAAADAKQTGDSLADKVDKVSGKGLSTNDYTAGEKTKLAGIETGATKTIIDRTLTVTGNAADAKAVGDAIASEDKKALAAFATDTATGAVASFADGADNIPMKDVLVHIDPVQAGSGDPSPDNVRPITGWTGAKVTRCGKNLFDVSVCTNGYYISTTGDISPDATSMYSDLISVNNGIYVFSMTNNDSVGRTIRIHGYDANGDWIEQVVTGNIAGNGQSGSISINISGSVTFIRVSLPNDATNIQLELGSTATAYEPYSGQTYSITFPTEAGTVYGGTLDVTKGELVVDRAMVDLGTMTWNYSGEDSNHRFSANMPPNYKRPGSAAGRANIVCSSYASNPDVVSVVNALGISGYQNSNGIFVRDLAYSDVSTFITAMSGVQCVYPLATPITYTLTPQEITSLLGANNLWADTGDTEVEYRADAKLYITKKITEAVSALS